MDGTERVVRRRAGAVVTLELNAPPRNLLDHPMRLALDTALAGAMAEPGVSAIVLRGTGRSFCAGADISEVDSLVPDRIPSAADLTARIDGSDRLVVAALHGDVLGEGLELALACHFRVAVPETVLGLPQIALGLSPGAGGVQRLARALGVETAADVILSGGPISASDAAALGLVDRLVAADVSGAAATMATEWIASEAPLPRLADRDAALSRGGDPETFLAASRERIRRRARGQIAPGRCIDGLADALTRPFADALARDRSRYVECRDSAQARAHRYLHLAPPAVFAADHGPPISRIAVVGCGPLGAGVAMSAVDAGLQVRVIEVSPDALARGLGLIRARYERAVAGGRLTAADVVARLGRLRPSTSLADVRDAEVCVEAVVEDEETKAAVHAALAGAVAPAAVVATTSSYLGPGQVAADVLMPERVLGLHFFHPAESTRLVEVACDARANPGAAARAAAFVRALGKRPVRVGGSSGYVSNRMFHCVLRQGCALVEEGALPQDVDRVLYDFGFPLGPFAAQDLAGLEVVRRLDWHPPGATRPALVDRLCEAGRTGQRVEAGWYRYDETEIAHPDPEVETLLHARSVERGIERREIEDLEILERCLLGAINEAVRVLSDRIVDHPSDLDLISVYGFGFPAHRGGPLYLAERRGLAKVCDALSRLARRHGPEFEPAPLLVEATVSEQGLGDTVV